MKQHITEKQLNELTIKQSAKLMYSFGDDDLAGGEDVTIGKMIEILNSLEWTLSLKQNSNWAYVSVVSGINAFGFESKKLCDALWEAVKGIL